MSQATYSGVTDLTLMLEAFKPFLINPPPDLLIDANAPWFAARAQYTMLRQRLTLLAVAMVIGIRAELGWLVRAEASYQLRDGLKVSAGYITYQPGSEFGPFYGLGRHDRLFGQLRWDFRLH